MKLIVATVDNQKYLASASSIQTNSNVFTLKDPMPLTEQDLTGGIFANYLRKGFLGNLPNIELKVSASYRVLTELEKVTLQYECGLFKVAKASALNRLICKEYLELRGK